MVSYTGPCGPAVAVPPASVKGGEPATEVEHEVFLRGALGFVDRR